MKKKVLKSIIFIIIIQLIGIQTIIYGVNEITNVYENEESTKQAEDKVTEDKVPEDKTTEKKVTKQKGTEDKEKEVSDDKGTEKKVVEEKFTEEKISEGLYKIALANDENKSITIENESIYNGANVCVSKYDEKVNQLFRIIYDNEGFAEIIALNSGKRIDICGWGNGVNIEQWGENKNTDSQKFKFLKNEKGNFNIVGKRQNLYITVNEKKQDNIEGNEKDTGKLQEFTIEKMETLESGRYRIAMANSKTQNVTVKDGKIGNGVKIVLNKNKDTVKQQYDIIYDDDGFCEIIPVHSEKRLDVCGWGNGVSVEQWCKNDNTDSQQWIIIKNEKGNFNIISKRQSLYLTAHDSNLSSGTKIEGYEKNGSDGQEFYLEKIEPKKNLEEGTYKITTASNRNKSITIANASNSNDAGVLLWNFNNEDHQEFNLEYCGNGYYEIIAVNSGKRLDVCGWGNGADIKQWNKNPNTDSQQWKIVKNAKGNYNIISKRQDLYLTANNSNFEDGTAIKAFEKNYSSGQEFKVEKIENKSEKTIEDGLYVMSLDSNRNMVVDTDCGSTANYTRLQVWQNLDYRWQKVKISYERGFYKINMYHSDKSLSVVYGKSSIESDVMQCGYNWGENQKWVVRDNGDGSISIYPRSNWNYSLSINGNIQNGSDLILNYDNKEETQKFHLERYYERYAEEGTYGWSGLKEKEDGNGGEDLKFYKVGNGNKKLFLNFSIHGFEDSYYRDGSELTYIADEFYKYMKKNMPVDLIDQWTIYILPNSNPDGQHKGWTNNGPGRTTLYSWANGNKGIDMNRCFPVNYKSNTKSTRNYNGTQPLQAYEAGKLRNFVLWNTGSKNIVIDVHGWLNETIGDNGIGWYYRNQFGISKHIGTYGSGYFIQWARTLANTRSMLLELPEVSSHNQVLERNYSNKFINATIQLLYDN